MSNKLRETPRYLAVELLTRINQQGTYSNLGINQVIKKHQLDEKNAHFFTNLVYGTLQHRLTLEYWLQPFIKQPQKVAPWVHELLLLSLYQMQYLTAVPEWAIFNEAIDIAKVKGHAGTRRFVTAVLRSIQRQGVRAVKEIKDATKRLSIETSTPLWLVKELTAELGLKKTAAILATTNEPSKNSIRFNMSQPTEDKLTQTIKDLRAEGLEVKKSQVAFRAGTVTAGFAPTSPAYQRGELSVQDESAMLAVESMQIKPGDQVLDACAAPGGKTTQIAIELNESGRVTALDIHAHKVKLIEANAKRIGVADYVQTQQLDAREVAKKFAAASFDKILVDAPCSGLGLLRRKPEIKYDKRLADSQKLQQIQLAILNAVAPTLKEGGQLTYSTCTILQGENQDVVDHFLAQHSEFEQIKTKTHYGIKDEREELSLTIYPDDFKSDGFFIATLIKKSR